MGFAVARLPPYVRRMPNEDLVRAFAAEFLLQLDPKADGHVADGGMSFTDTPDGVDAPKMPGSPRSRGTPPPPPQK